MHASILRARGEIEEARRVLHETLPVLQRLGDLEAEAEACLELARIAAKQGDPRLALRRLHEAEALASRTDERILQGDIRDAFALTANERVRITLCLEKDARTIEISGKKIDLGRRTSIRRILLALAHAQREGRALSTDDLIAAGWPGERMRRESGTARVYMAIRRLRALGLEDVLHTRDEGYFLDSKIDLRIES
jgi:hypothetical protein